MIEYRKGDLFQNLTGNEIIAHACNAQGVWGSGFARECKERFPNDFIEYQRFCEWWNCGTGKSFLSDGNKNIQGILCLIASEKYGKLKDSPEKILHATKYALNYFSTLLNEEESNFFYSGGSINIVSPKINSGLFGVPWTDTETVINNFIENSERKINWTVYEN
jgi:ADP-ribose 1''-phosphate phosphatase